ncbi:MAG: preprotein translocase subunit SecY [Phycisphaerae bacterium]|nr:preprotein translocase subunit SecY [Phycisphaerae bacterium]
MEDIFSIPELLRKLAFTLALLCIYRIGWHITLPGVDVAALQQQHSTDSDFGTALAFFGMFTGGNLQQATLFGLGIMPYISASIIFQLLATVVPALRKLQKEGPAGYKKIQEYTRYATVFLCVIQAMFWVMQMRPDASGADGLFYQHAQTAGIFIVCVVGLTAGTMFMMWLGEQIDEYGIGNGISLIIMAGIVARLPWAVDKVIEQSTFSLAAEEGTIGPTKLLILVVGFLVVVSGAILITQGQRRIPIQQAKQTRGRRVYGGQRQYLPLRVNHGGVMPIIFASALMMFPMAISGWAARNWRNSFTEAMQSAFNYGSYIYCVVEVALIFFFAYFWTTVQFRPKEMAEQLRDHGHFIPGLRPGKRTADYLERVMERITYCGAAFLAAIAVIPQAVHSWLHIDFQVSQFLGGTGLLIVVSVALDLVQRIESNLVMRNYGGFLGGSTRIKGAYRQ